MSENVDNIILEQLRLIREDMRGMSSRMDQMNEKIDDLHTGQQALQGVVMSLGLYLHNLDERVEHLEETIGGKV